MVSLSLVLLHGETYLGLGAARISEADASVKILFTEDGKYFSRGVQTTQLLG